MMRLSTRWMRTSLAVLVAGGTASTLLAGWPHGLPFPRTPRVCRPPLAPPAPAGYGLYQAEWKPYGQHVISAMPVENTLLPTFAVPPAPEAELPSNPQLFTVPPDMGTEPMPSEVAPLPPPPPAPPMTNPPPAIYFPPPVNGPAAAPEMGAILDWQTSDPTIRRAAHQSSPRVPGERPAPLATNVPSERRSPAPSSPIVPVAAQQTRPATATANTAVEEGFWTPPANFRPQPAQSSTRVRLGGYGGFSN